VRWVLRSKGTARVAETLELRRLTESEIGCRPTLCFLGDRAHAHCACGLPMQIGSARCSLCGLEQLDPTPEQPSRRRNRISCGDGLLAFVSAVFDRDRTTGVAA